MPVRIAIPDPTSQDESYNRLSWQPYADAVRASGGEPIRVPLGGGTDQARHEACAPADHVRESVDRFLLETAEISGKPLRGICFGMQMINVFYGGTLIQDLTVLPIHHSAGRSVVVAHTVAIEPASLLTSIVDAGELETRGGSSRLPVNSSHHQAVGIVAPGLRAVGHCPQDGVVEAIEQAAVQARTVHPFLLGVQWHPERTLTRSLSSQRIFARLLQEAEACRG